MKVLAASMSYGEWLNVAFDKFTREKLSSRIETSWSEWLTKNVGIKDSYARKLRDMDTKFRSYKRLRNLSISFSELYDKRHDIESMLRSDDTIAKFWTEQNQ
jgi:hypothetical protein